ncbi:hypothetical protein FHG87_002449 [Trinorchestia longiramus]|nr:hypothetical protein FHG87_002449 [Trinorchestia longiramus]
MQGFRICAHQGSKQLQGFLRWVIFWHRLGILHPGYKSSIDSCWHSDPALLSLLPQTVALSYTMEKLIALAWAFLTLGLGVDAYNTGVKGGRYTGGGGSFGGGPGGIQTLPGSIGGGQGGGIQTLPGSIGGGHGGGIQTLPGSIGGGHGGGIQTLPGSVGGGHGGGIQTFPGSVGGGHGGGIQTLPGSVGGGHGGGIQTFPGSVGGGNAGGIQTLPARLPSGTVGFPGASKPIQTRPLPRPGRGYGSRYSRPGYGASKGGRY